MVNCLARPARAAADPEIAADAVSAGGKFTQSGSYGLQDIIGQGPVGPIAEGTTILLQDGFWAAALAAGPAEGDTLPPADVAGFTAVPYDEHIELSWANPADPDFHKTLVRYSDQGFPADTSQGLPVENIWDGYFFGSPGEETAFNHENLTNGVLHYYTIFAFDHSGNFSEGVGDSATPYDWVAPGQVMIELPEPGDQQVTLRWTNPTDQDFEHTLIVYSLKTFPEDPDSGIPVEDVTEGKFFNDPATADSFTHTGLTNGTVYYYGFFAADEVPNYSADITVSAVPQDTYPPGPLASFEAVPLDNGSVRLRWTAPGDSDVEGILIRYAAGACPDTISSGAAVPHGPEGLFVAEPAGVDSFDHTGLTVGTAYCYSAFAYDEVPNYASRVTAQATPQDETDPVLEISIFQNPYLTSHLDVYVIASEALDGETVDCTVGGTETEMTLIDAAKNVWQGDYDLFATGPVTIAVSASDLAGNEAEASREFSSALVGAASGGVATSPDRRCRLSIPGGQVGRDTYVLIVEAPCVEALGPVYEMSPAALEIGGYADISISVPDNVAEPRHLAVARFDGDRIEPVESYLDLAEAEVTAYVGELGRFGLVWRSDITTQAYQDRELVVFQNIPNPFANATEIRFEVPRPERVTIEIISIDGRIVTKLLDEHVLPGRRSVEWSGRDSNGRRVAGGVYFYRVSDGSKTVTRKMVHLH
jgi:hypothetical protein